MDLCPVRGCGGPVWSRRARILSAPSRAWRSRAAAHVAHQKCAQRPVPGRCFHLVVSV